MFGLCYEELITFSWLVKIIMGFRLSINWIMMDWYVFLRMMA